MVHSSVSRATAPSSNQEDREMAAILRSQPYPPASRGPEAVKAKDLSVRQTDVQLK